MNRGERERLPPRRATVTHEVKLRRQDGHLTVFVGCSWYADGRPAELWVDSMKEGHELRSAHQAWARMVSVSLQHGTPVDAIKPPPCPDMERAIVEIDGTAAPVSSFYEAALMLLRPRGSAPR